MLNVLNISIVHDEFKERDLSFCNFVDSSRDTVTFEQLEAADVLIGNPTMEQLSHAKKIQLYQHSAAGSDGLRKENYPHGCVVCNATGTFGTGISEYIIGSLIMMMRNFPLYHNQQKENLWKRKDSLSTISGSTILVVGFGNIGYEFARKANYMGAKIIGIRRHPEDKPEFVEKMGTLDDLDKFLPEADAVVLALPNSKSTTGIITTTQFNLMKPTAFMVNVGRGTAVVGADLYEALSTNKITAAAFDVFETEPLPSDSNLWSLNNLIITPHASGNLDLKVTKNNFVDITLYNINQLLTNKQFKNEVDFSTGYRRYENKVESVR